MPDLIELINKQLSSDNPPEDLPDVPEAITTFLGSLGMLADVPLYYLIPNEAYLPLKSFTSNNIEIELGAFKFFRLDKEWIENLFDGALSIGGNQDRSFLLTKAMEGSYVAAEFARMKKAQVLQQVKGAYQGKDATAQIEKRLADYQVTHSATKVQANWNYTGFIMRSSLITSWPGVEITASGTDDLDSPVRALQVIRQERIATDTLFCLCEGIITLVTISQPPETFHFGVAADAPMKPKINGASNMLDIIALAQSKGVPEKNSAKFARQMVATPLQFNITINN